MVQTHGTKWKTNLSALDEKGTEIMVWSIHNDNDYSGICNDCRNDCKYNQIKGRIVL